MARKKSSPRRRPAIKILNVLESLTYAEIISRGTTGGGLGSLIFGDTNLEYSEGGRTQVYDGGLGVSSSAMMEAGWQGQGQISLGDLITQPGQAVTVMAQNFQSNLIPMAVAGFTTAAGFNVGKRLLRSPINNINRNIMKPIFGRGIKL